ncbi:MAG: tandem-95 repeat protein, partial [Methylocystis sp.]|nr:tandem-95 repeat protein [Methylocystis sp.]
TAWVDADGGLLAMDRDGDGRINDSGELFGGPGRAGFQVLALLDGNRDGKIDAQDAEFERLRVWRDLDQDGVSDEGELFSLAALGITSIDVIGTPLGVTTPAGVTLREQAGFTRADGTTGKIFEGLFQTDLVETVFNGDRGVAGFAARAADGAAFNIKGYGRLTDLAVTLSNDLDANASVRAVADAMVTPDLQVLRRQAAVVMGDWAEALANTRELTAVRVLPGGETLADYAIYKEDAQGGYYQLKSGQPLLNAAGQAVARPQLTDFFNRAAEADGSQWRLEQMFSPSDRAAAVNRAEVPYLVEVINGRALVKDFGIKITDAGGSYWQRASGEAVVDAQGQTIARPTLADLRAFAMDAGEHWRMEEIGFNSFRALPFDKVAVYLIDGIVTQYSVYVEDAQGGFYVWSTNLDRALEQQHNSGLASSFGLRNYAIDFNTLPEVNATDDSAYRVELMTIGQFRFASSLYSIDFRPEILHAAVNASTGMLQYNSGGLNGGVGPNADGSYASVVTPTLGLFGNLMEQYLHMSRAVAVRLAADGGLASSFAGVQYDAEQDAFIPVGGRELAPMFQAIFERAPDGAAAAVRYLSDWADILDRVYPDYRPRAEEDISKEAIFQMIVAGYENAALTNAPDVTLVKAASLLKIDEARIITHAAADSLVNGTARGDIFYISGGDQTIKGGLGSDTYVVGRNFGHDVIEDFEGPLGVDGLDVLRFAHVRSDQVYAYKDGIDLVIEVIGTNDVLTVKSQFEGDYYDLLFGSQITDNTEMVNIVFADGVVWNALDIANATNHPQPTNDVVIGTGTLDILEGGAGNDILRGGRDGDIYIYKTGSGVDRIEDNNDSYFGRHKNVLDIVAFGSGISIENIRFERIGTSKDLSLVMLDNEGQATGDRLEVKNQFNVLLIDFFFVLTLWADRIERFVFADNSFLSEADVMRKVVEQAKTAGNDAIIGFFFEDSIDGGAGNDYLSGGDLDDTYVFGRGYGHDVIEDNLENFTRSSYDTVVFKDGLRPEDFDFIRVGDSATITMQLRGTDDVLTLTNQFLLTSTLFGDYYFDGVDQLSFGDGTEWDLDAFGQYLINQNRTGGNDTIYGFDKSDTLDGGAGNDRLEGGVYSDTYIFKAGYGHDVIFDSAAKRAGEFLAAGSFDTLIMDGIAFEDVTISRFKDNLIFTLKSSGESVTLENQYNRYSNETIERLIFEDQTIPATDLFPEDVPLVGTAASETLWGTNYGEVIDGRAGDDTLIGYSGGDTYKFDVGYGRDVIFDRIERADWTGDDTILFGADITIANIRFAKSGNDLLITIAGHTDSLLIQRQFDTAGMGVEWFQFNDGTRWSIRDVEALPAIALGGRGDDNVTGLLTAVNVLDGRQGDDTLSGGNLGDTYVFDAGYDIDTVVEVLDSRANGGAIDKVVFGELITPENLIVRRSGTDLVIGVAGTEDQLRIVEGLSVRQIEQFQFNNGTVWTMADIRDALIKPTSGDDILIGYDNVNDTLDGGQGSDQLEGGLGNDTYRFNLGSGADSILDAGGAADKIIFGAYITAQMLEFRADGDNLVIRIKGYDDSLVIIDMLSTGPAARQIETLAFADGSALTLDMIRQRLIDQQVSSSDDIVTGYSDRSDILTGGAGYDRLNGLYGDDVYEFRAGDGFDIIDETNGSGFDRVEVKDYRSSDAVVRRVHPEQNDLVISFTGTADQILIKDGLVSEYYSRIEQIAFADRAVWTIADLRARVLSASATSGNDVIQGFDGDETLQGGRGDDDLNGQSGSDTYVFTRNDGRDTVNDTGYADSDTLKILGYAPGDVRVVRPLADRSDLQLFFEGTSDTILLKNQVSPDAGLGLERITFSDGTIWLRADIIARLTQGGGDAGEEIVGSNSADTLIGRGGDDTLKGARGSDTYVFLRGDGRDVLDDEYYSFDGPDRLELRDYQLSEAIFTQAGNDLVISFNGTQDEIRLVNGLAGTGDTNELGIEQIVFAGGAILNRSDIKVRLLTAAATTGNDGIRGFAGPDTLRGGLGDDTLNGDEGADTYIFTRGDGRDVIDDEGYWYWQTDSLRLQGYLPSELRLSRINDDLIVRFAGTTDELRLVNALSGTASQGQYGVEEIVFDDGTIWNRDALKALVIASPATSGDDRIFGSSAAETLAGGRGDDILKAGDGSDTYVFSRGDGSDIIDEEGNANGQNDVLLLQGYLPSELRLSRINDDLIVRFVGTTDELRLINGLSGTTNTNEYGVEQIVFDDGTIWNRDALKAQVLSASQTSGNDVITGFAGDQTLTGGWGNDTLAGLSGNDTYIFARGDGRDVISENSFYDTDQLKIQGYLPNELRLSRINDDLIVRFIGTTDELRLINALSGSTNADEQGVDLIAFDDGTIWNRDALKAQVLSASQTSGNDVITGLDGDQTLTGGLGNDTLSGLYGNDTYIFARGDGRDVIDDYGYSSADQLRIQGYLPSQLRLSRINEDLIVRFVDTTDELRLINSLSGSTNADEQGVELIAFDDGTIWNRDALKAQVLLQSGIAGNDSLTGTPDDETLIGGLGDDTLSGQGGNDTYVFARGDGRDVIDVSGYSDFSTNQIKIGEYLPSDLVLSQYNNNIIIDFKGTGDRITIIYSEESFYFNAIPQIVFDNGTIWTAADLAQRVTAAQATAGNDSITGTFTGTFLDETLNGGSGDDTLSGQGWSNTYVFARGDGRDVIEANGYSGDVQIRIEAYLPSDVILSIYNKDFNIDFAGTSDSITVVSPVQGNYLDTIDKIVFDNGTIWTNADVAQRVTAAQATTGNDSITGTRLDDTLTGGTGDDTLSGQRGNDTYVFARGDGRDVIEDDGYSGADRISIKGYLPSEALLSPHNNDLVIRFAGTSDSLTVINTIDGDYSDSIEEVVFDNGTIWSAADLAQRLTPAQATTGNDSITGTFMDETLNGGAGDDTLSGGSGSDTYVFARGDGRDVIEENGYRYSDTDRIRIQGYLPSEAMLSRYNNDLTIRFAGTNDSLTVINALGGDAYDMIEQFAFDDGTVWTSTEIVQQLLLDAGTVNSDIIVGSAGADRLAGARGDDRLNGLDGGDTYVFARGDGRDTIDDNGGWSGTDTIEIAGYSAAEIRFQYAGVETSDLLIRFTGSNDTITVVNGLSGNWADLIERVVLKDSNTIITLAEIAERVLLDAATDGIDFVLGTPGDDRLTGGKGADLLDGDAGDDIYIYRAGDGDDRIIDAAGSLNDRLDVLEYLPTDVISIKRSPPDGDDLVLTFRGIGDRLLMSNTLSSDAAGIESVTFSDGTVWTLPTLRQLVLDGAGTAASERIWGFDGAETLTGRAGDDWLSGGGGADTYVYAKGDGIDTIEDRDTAADVDRILISGYTSAQASVQRFYKGDDGIVLSFAGGTGDGLIILNTLSGSASDTIEQITFADGVTWTMAKVLDLLENAIPVARDDGLFSAVRGKVSVIAKAALLNNDYDADQDALSIIAVANASHGSVSLDAQGNVIVTADPAYLGLMTFDYTVSDGGNGLATATVQIRVRPEASATDDSGFTGTEDGFVLIRDERLLSNDFDGDILTISQVLGAVHGTVTRSNTGDIVFTPDADYNGPASFRYVANTPDGGRAEATVRLTITGVNDAPVAVNDRGFTLQEGTSFEIAAETLLANDQDVDGDALTVTAVAGNSNLSVALSADGYIRITPAPFYFGTTTFSYTISDGEGGSALAVATIAVTPVNDAPETVTDSVTMTEDVPLYFSASTLLANDIEHDGETMVVTRVFGGSGMSVELLANGQIYVTPFENFYGQGSFFYEVGDGQGGFSVGGVNAQVNPVNDAPYAQGESYTDNGVNFLRGVEDTPLMIDAARLLANDGDIDSASISIASVSYAVNGTVALGPDGQVVFTPDADYWGEASFRYVVQDGSQAVADALVTLYIDPVADGPPVAGDDIVTGYEDVTLVIPSALILSNDTDVDRDPLRISAVRVRGPWAPYGTAWLNTDGSVSVRGNLNLNGTLELVYTVTDDADGSDMGSIDVTLLPVDDAPDAAADTASTSLGAPLVVRISDLLANDSDVDVMPEVYAAILRFVSAQLPSSGILSVYQNEFVVVEMADGYSGPVSFSYTIKDDGDLTDDGLVSGLVSSTRASVISGTAQRDLLIGANWAERIEGGAGDDDIFARVGDDTIAGGPGADSVDGGDGFDTISFEASNIFVRADIQSRVGQGGHAQGDIYTNIEAILGSAYSDLLYGNTGGNRIDGGAGNDLIAGRAGADTLLGGLNDDTLDGGEGADYLDGGAGSDTVDYSTSVGPVTVSLLSGVVSGGDAAGDVLVNIESLIGTIGADRLEGDGQANRLSGGRGNDTLQGGSGDDVLIGGKGADILAGDAGIDIADYSGSSEAVGIDMTGLTAGGGDAEGDAYSGVEIIYGSNHNDTIIGDSGDNMLRGGGGADSLRGGLGFDTADYSNAAAGVIVNLTAGLGTGGDADGDQLNGFEKLLGSSFADHLTGDALANVFEGGDGFDTLAGAGGSDIYLFGFDSRDDTIIENGPAFDFDRLVLKAGVTLADVSVVREGDDLLVELENDDGFLIDTVLVKDHFLGSSTGIEEISFADGRIWNRADIDFLSRNGRFNAVDDVIRWADEDIPYLIAASRLTLNDTATQDPGLTILSVQNSVNGTAVLKADGSVTFTGAEDFHGAAFFDYTVTDGRGRQSTATAEVTIRPVNDAPVAGNDGIFTGYEDTELFIPFSALFGNDFDVDGDLLRVTDILPALNAQGQPIYTSRFWNASNGGAEKGVNGITFLGAGDYAGYAGFRYTITDPSGLSATAQVDLQILGINDAPRPDNDQLTTRMGQSVTITVADLLSNDSDPEGDAISFMSLGTGSNGTAVLQNIQVNGVPTLSVVFTPAANFLGEATFTYVIADNSGAQATGTAKIRVDPLNDRPNAVDDYGFTLLQDTEILIDATTLLLNDTDINNDTLLISALDLYAEHGEVTWTGDGKIAFTPRQNYNGDASFTYTISDGRGGFDTATVHLTVTPTNRAPSVFDDVVDGLEDLPIFLSAFDAFANDSDPEGDVLYFSAYEFMGILENDFGNRTPIMRDFDPTSFELTAGSTANVTFANGQPLPAWLSFNSTSWTLTGIPPVDYAGTLNLVVTAKRVDNLTDEVITASKALSLIIAPPASGTSADPVNLDFDPADFIVGQQAAVTAKLADGRALPSWLSFDAQTWTFTGTPPEKYVGRLDIVVTALEAAGTEKTTYAFEIAVDPEIRLGNGTLDTGYDDRPPVSQTLGANALVVAPGAIVTATLANGRPLPDWLNFDAQNLTVSGMAPDHYIGQLDIRITSALRDPMTGQVSLNTALMAVVVDQPVGPFVVGGLTLAGDNLRIATGLDFNGSIAIRYKAEDLKHAVSDDWAIAVINVLPQRELPTPAADRFNTVEDQLLSLTLDQLLANDTDKDGDAIRFVSLTQPRHGTVELVPLPLNYALPASATAGLTAAAALAFSASLTAGGSLPSWLTIDAVTGVLSGVPPLDFAGSILVKVTATDGITSVVSNQSITARVNDHYRIVYVPAAEYSGPDSFSYTITDGREGPASAVVSLTVTPANDAPVAGVDTLATVEETILRFSVASILANDVDVDGDAIRLVSIGSPGHGTAVIDGRDIVYTPGYNFDGQDTLTYTITDDQNGTSQGTIRINVAANNRAPVAGADTYSGIEDQSVIVTVAQLLANDSDPDGDAISFIGVQQIVPHSRASILPDGRVLFTPDADYAGEIRFAYQITDGRLISPTSAELTGTGASSYRNVVITFTNVNDAPTAVADSGYTIVEDGSLAISTQTLLANDSDKDGDALTFNSVGNPVNGAVVLVNGTVIFTPRADYFGNAGFEYTVSDGNGGLSTAFVSLDVTPANDLPFAAVDSGFQTLEDTSVEIDIATLLANDVDPDGDTIQFLGVTGAQVIGNGKVRFTPEADANGLQQFTYQITDGNGPAVTGTVTVNVTPVDDAPRPVDDSRGMSPQDLALEDTVLTIPILSLLANDREPDGHSFQLASVSNPVNGQAALDGLGNVVFTPSTNFNGAASFGYTVIDTTGMTGTATVTLNYTPVNDAPLPQADTGFVTPANTSLIISSATLLANDIDPDLGDLLTISTVGGASRGTVTLAANGAITFVPEAGYVGAASFTYTVSDGHGGNAVQTVSINVVGAIINGTAASEVLNGTASADLIFGFGGNDTINAGIGNDIINGGAGADSMIGGAGDDIYEVDNEGDVAVEATTSGTDTIQSSVSYTAGKNIEILTLTGSAAINGTGNTLANVLTGNSADNV